MASDSSVQAFLGLGADQQKSMLGQLSPEAKQGLLTALQARGTGQPTEAPEPGQKMIGGPLPPPASAKPAVPPPPGFFSRAAEGLGIPRSEAEFRALEPTTGEKIVDILAPGGRQIYNVVKNVAGHAREAAHEVKEAGDNAAAGEPVLPQMGKAAYGVVKGAVNSVPGVGPPVENFGEDVAQGNTAGAVGDALATTVQALLMRGITKKPTLAKQAQNLTFATTGGKAAEGVSMIYERVMPELNKTAEVAGIPARPTVGDLHGLVQDTLTRVEQPFNKALTLVGGRTVVPSDIAAALLIKAREMPPSAAGRAIRQAILDVVPDYRKPWTLNQLNAERMMRNNFLESFYSKEGSAQMGAMRGAADSIIDKIVADNARDVLYNTMEKQFRGAPPGFFKALKQTSGDLIQLKDKLDLQVKNLHDVEMGKRGQPLTAKPTVTATASPHGMLARIHNLIPGRGVESAANLAVRKAFRPTPTSQAVRAGILALPITALGRDDSEGDDATQPGMVVAGGSKNPVTSRPAVPPPPGSVQ